MWWPELRFPLCASPCDYACVFLAFLPRNGAGARSLQPM